MTAETKTPTKGVRARKQKTKGEIAKENEALKKQLEPLQRLVMNSSRGVIELRNEISILQKEQQVIVELLRYQGVDKKCDLGDFVMIDFLGRFKNDDGSFGEMINGAVGLGYTFKLGKGNFVPGFEDQIKGLAAGANKRIEVTFPEDYTDELKGKKAYFDIAVLKVYGELENGSHISEIHGKILQQKEKERQEAAEKEASKESEETSKE